MAEISGDCQAVAGTMGARDSVLRVSGGSTEGGVHHQRSGIAAHELAQNHQDPRFLSERGSRPQAAVSGARQGGGQMGNGAELEANAELPGLSLRRSDARS